MNEPELQPATTLDIQQILQLLPHRYPFLLVDRIIECVAHSHINGYKNVSFNEPFFQGHFPELPVMPGVMIIEALAQTGGIMVLNSLPKEETAGKLFLFTGIDKVKFRRPVLPGDRLDLHCKLVRHKMMLWRMEGKALVDGKLAAEAELTAAITPRGDI